MISDSLFLYNQLIASVVVLHLQDLLSKFLNSLLLPQ